MKLFTSKQNEELAEKLESAESENAQLRADLTAAQARIEELQGLAEANAALQNDLNEVSGKLAEAEKLSNEQAEKIATLEEAATVTEEKVSNKAAELLAATGHPNPVSLVDDAGETKSLLDQFNEMKGADATRFYQKHRKAILAEQAKLNP